MLLSLIAFQIDYFINLGLQTVEEQNVLIFGWFVCFVFVHLTLCCSCNARKDFFYKVEETKSILPCTLFKMDHFDLKRT